MAVKRASPKTHARRHRRPRKTASVSVIIPAYRARRTLPRALNSIAHQTLKPLEILVCDDGSPDRTWDYLMGLGRKYRGIPLRAFKQDNAGAGAARNRCLMHARGKYVAFLDADDEWLPHKLERSVHFLEKGVPYHPHGHKPKHKPHKPTFVAHDFYAVNAQGIRTHWHCARNAHRHDWFNRKNPRLHYFYRGFIGILTVVMRKDALVKAGGFHGRDRYGLDWEAWHAVMARDPHATFYVFDEPLALYHASASGLTAKGLERLREREVHLRRYVRIVGRRHRMAWPVLYLRGWITLQYEAMYALAKSHQPERLGYVLLRLPFSLAKNMAAVAMAKPYRRPDFLAALRKAAAKR
jgi:glycosyltransferase involved in cell wall biosynthesis